MILKTDPVHPVSAVLDQAAEVLAGGGLVVAPTETRYGLLARADLQPLLERLYDLKRRQLNQPTALLVRNADEIEQIGILNSSAKALVEQFLPGPLTLVLRAKQNWSPPRVVDGRVGLRWSSSITIQELLARVDQPLTATSANISGQGEHECVQEIEKDFGSGVDLYLDAGSLRGQTSSVVDCSGVHIRILREGAIARTEIEKAVDGLNG